MTNIDQFESVFKAASKPVFEFTPVQIRRVLLVTDLQKNEAETYAGRVRSFLGAIGSGEEVDWRIVLETDFETVGELLERVDAEKPDVICSYRNLRSTAWRWPHSLGVHLDVLTQVTDHPVLVLPHPGDDGGELPSSTSCVMAITDHMAGDARLVNVAADMTAPGGRLLLTHVEDEATFERYIDAISKIPEIETEAARETILHQLLKEPHDYIRSCREVLEAQDLPLELEEIVGMGHHLSDYRRLIEEHQVDLLVLNTKDEGQLAMHGVAYALAVELRRIPLLML